MRLSPIKLCSLVTLCAACATCANDTKPRSAEDDSPPVGVEGSEPVRDSRALETAEPNVPEFKPAFPEQTRAPGSRSATTLDVAEIGGTFENPWGVAFLPDGRMLVTEKLAARMTIVSPDGTKSAPISGLPPVDAGDQGGLLDVAVPRDYAQSGLIYWTYYEPREGGNGLAVARARLVDGATPSVAELKVIFRMEPTLDSSKHAGGRLLFAPDDKLFVTLGERSIMEGRVQARDLGSHLGKIVRIEPDGSVPDDNPFVNRAGARPEIWSFGHRNVLGAALDDDNRLWVVEMGPRGGDELNLVERGKDYGWPTIGYGEEYSGSAIHTETQAEGMEQPVYYWDPVISPGGLAIYSGDVFPEWKGDFFIGGLSSKALVRLELEDGRVVGEERLLTDRGKRVRDVVQGPEGALYVLTDEQDGRLLRLTRAASAK